MSDLVLETIEAAASGNNKSHSHAERLKVKVFITW